MGLFGSLCPATFRAADFRRRSISRKAPCTDVLFLSVLFLTQLSQPLGLWCHATQIGEEQDLSAVTGANAKAKTLANLGKSQLYTR